MITIKIDKLCDEINVKIENQQNDKNEIKQKVIDVLLSAIAEAKLSL